MRATVARVCRLRANPARCGFVDFLSLRFSRSHPLVIIGAGRAGMAAAIGAARSGNAALVLDQASASACEPVPGDVANRILLAPGTSVLSISADREIFWSGHGRSGTFRAEKIVLATGRSPRAVPFPGWTLPGVHEARSVTDQEIRAGMRVLVAGAGSGVITIAKRLAEAGATIVAALLADEASMEQDTSIPIHTNHAIYSAWGSARVSSATFGPVDPETWTPLRSEARTESVDLVVYDFGGIARDALATLAGCHMEIEPVSGEWRPICDPDGKTSVPGIIWAVANAANHAPYLRDGLLDLVEPETIVCRCEAVPFGTLCQEVAKGALDLTTLKLRSRIGMGSCQGRECGLAAGWLLAKETHRGRDAIGRINPRPPALPVTLGALSRMTPNTPPPVVIGEAR